MQLTWRILSQDSESKGGTIISISSLYTQHIPQQKKISCRIEGRKRINSTVDRTMKLTKWTNQNAHKGGEKEKYNKETQKVEMTDLVGSRPCLVGLSVVWPTWDYFTGLSFWLKQTNGAQNTYIYISNDDQTTIRQEVQELYMVRCTARTLPFYGVRLMNCGTHGPCPQWK